MSTPSDVIPDDTIADIVQQHLVGNVSPATDEPEHRQRQQQQKDHSTTEAAPMPTTDDIPVPYHLVGTAVTHDIYTHANHLIQQQQQQLQRSKSTSDLRTKGGSFVHGESSDDALDSAVAFEHLDKPGGFRRFHIHQQKLQQQQGSRHSGDTDTVGSHSPAVSAFDELFRPTSAASHTYTDLYQPSSLAHSSRIPSKPTRHFLEYLALTSLVGHFAGEDLSDSDQEEQERPDDEERGEQTPLLSAGRQRYPNKAERRKLRRQQSQHDTTKHKTNVLKTVFLLFKAFIGSGILFLPKAFSNGGLAVAVAVIWLMGCISLYCFLLLLDCKKSIAGSYGDIGEATYGPWMRRIVLFSIAISQLGFVCGGTIFILENVIQAVKGLCGVALNPNWLLLAVCVLLMPLVLIRNIAKLSPTALLSDVLIITGLLVLVVYDMIQLFVINPSPTSSSPTPGPNMIWVFNPAHFSVFVGTAVYSFEGIGLIIPIRDAMENPEKFPMVLTGTMGMVAGTLCLIGTLGYMAFGSNVATVALLNLPSGPLPNTVQLGYAVAVQLSNVLALFPTIRIVEQALFGNRTGKYNSKIKWEKNGVRFAVVTVTGMVAFLGANDLDKFISLIGSICCCPLSLIFPPLFHLKLPTTTGISRWIDVLLVSFGLGVMSFTLYNTSKQWGSSI